MKIKEFKSGLLPIFPVGSAKKSKTNRLATGVTKLPEVLDNWMYFHPADDQGRTSECAAYAWAGHIEGVRWFYDGTYQPIDPHPLYLRSKELDGSPGTDGTDLMSCFKATLDLKLWGRLKPTEHMITDLDDIPYFLHHSGAVVGGLNITEAWQNVGKNGLIAEGKPFIGGHAQVICSHFPKEYDGIKHKLELYGDINSWGLRFGHRGRCLLSRKEMEREFLYAIGITFK